MMGTAHRYEVALRVAVHRESSKLGLPRPLRSRYDLGMLTSQMSGPQLPRVRVKVRPSNRHCAHSLILAAAYAGPR